MSMSMNGLYCASRSSQQKNPGATLEGLVGKAGYSEWPETSASDMYLTRSAIPDWFKYKSTGSSIPFDIKSHFDFELFDMYRYIKWLPLGSEMPNPVGMTLWIVYEEREDGPVMTHSPEAIIVNRTNGVELRYKFPLSFGPHPHSPGTHSWVSYIPFKYLGYPIEGGAKMEVSFEINQPLRVKQSGIYLVYAGESGEYEGEATWDYLVDSGEQKQKRKMLF
ncbi:hypothetical protein LguiB_009698 [Lonicera macranthoides]